MDQLTFAGSLVVAVLKIKKAKRLVTRSNGVWFREEKRDNKNKDKCFTRGSSEFPVDGGLMVAAVLS